MILHVKMCAEMLATLWRLESHADLRKRNAV